MTSTTATPTAVRNATLADLAAILKDQQSRKVDLVTPAATLRAEGGDIVVEGAEPVIDEDGVTDPNGAYRPTQICDEGVSEKLGIPQQYLRRLRDTGRTDIWDANVNGWLHGNTDTAPADGRNFMLRAFQAGDGGMNVARALLSDAYGRFDHLDALTAALQGMQAAGVEVEIDRCDLTDRRMYVRVACPAVATMAPVLLNGYKSPFADPNVRRANGISFADGRRLAAAEGQAYDQGAEPVVFAGFVLKNSETGDGAFSITPSLIVKVCKNGLTITSDAVRATHLGSRLPEGVIRWSHDTAQKNAALITARTTDAVRTFLDIDYLTRKVADLETLAGKPIDGDIPAKVKAIGKDLLFPDHVTDGVLDHFIRGGQLTAGGVLGAVTSYAQTVADADTAYDIEAKGLRALALAAA